VDLKPDEVLVHDERSESLTLAFLLSRMCQPEFPEPMGIFRAVTRPTYEEMVLEQNAEAIKKQGEGALQELLNGQDGWTVNE